ncbi:MAG: hypothetical protein U0175_19855 [Caldilineaceae bacterium]
MNQGSNGITGSGQSYGSGTIENPCILAPVNTGNNNQTNGSQNQGMNSGNNNQNNGGQNQGMNNNGNNNQSNSGQNNGTTANNNNQNNSGQGQGMNDGSNNNQNNNNQNNSGQSASQGLCADYQFGSTRQDARWPVPGYVQIEPKQTQWYRFRYNPQIDTTDSDTGNDQPAETTIQMRSSVPGCVNFDVQTRERMNVQQSLSDSELDPSLRGPVGRGSPAFRNTDDQGNTKEDTSNLIWVGRSGAADNYYVIVHNDSTNTCSYLLTIKGTGVSF